MNPAVVLLAKRSPKPCLWGLAIGLFSVLVFETSALTQLWGWGVVLLYAWVTPLALVLGAGAARAAGVIRRAKDIIAVAIAYIVVGLVLVFPAPPISRAGYNPVGLFFPVWGFGVPWVATMLALARLSRTVGPDVSRSGSDLAKSGPGSSEESPDVSRNEDFLP